jgi:hypothetical protein
MEKTWVRYILSHINDTLFSDLKIIKDNKVLYNIDQHKLLNINGIDVEARQNNFFGWTFLLKKKDSFVLNLYYDQGKSIADNVNIDWNYDKKLFEVLKAP